MALILKQPDANTIILKRGFLARLSSLIWFSGAGIFMFMPRGDNRIWIVIPCLLIGIHVLTYTVRIQIRRSGRDILWKRRILLLFATEQSLLFAGVRSVRVGTRGILFKMCRLYFFLIDASELSITQSYSADRITAQGDALAKFMGKPLVYKEQSTANTKSGD
ncbi:MAG: hypothetical protein O7E52_03410 [Candidatus Poribacteria bacterium]|nr:hypothetical protein [Candidatus Poribacteria bacterium]